MRLLEATMNVSEYTDKVSLFRFESQFFHRVSLD